MWVFIIGKIIKELQVSGNESKLVIIIFILSRYCGWIKPQYSGRHAVFLLYSGLCFKICKLHRLNFTFGQDNKIFAAATNDCRIRPAFIPPLCNHYPPNGWSERFYSAGNHK